MSKYSEELQSTFPTIADIKRATKDLIKDGGKLAFQEYYKASSLERLKKEVMK